MVLILDTPESLSNSAVLADVVGVVDFAVIRTVRSMVEPDRVPYRILLRKIDMRLPGQHADAERLLDELGLP